MRMIALRSREFADGSLPQQNSAFHEKLLRNVKKANHIVGIASAAGETADCRLAALIAANGVVELWSVDNLGNIQIIFSENVPKDFGVPIGLNFDSLGRDLRVYALQHGRV